MAMLVASLARTTQIRLTRGHPYGMIRIGVPSRTMA